MEGTERFSAAAISSVVMPPNNQHSYHPHELRFLLCFQPVEGLVHEDDIVGVVSSFHNRPFHERHAQATTFLGALFEPGPFALRRSGQ